MGLSHLSELNKSYSQMRENRNLMLCKKQKIKFRIILMDLL